MVTNPNTVMKTELYCIRRPQYTTRYYFKIVLNGVYGTDPLQGCDVYNVIKCSSNVIF